MSNLSKIRIKDANGVEKEHNIVDSRVGNLIELTTENKENLVNAINEVKGDIENKASKDLSNVTNEDFLNKCSVAGIPDASTKMDKDNPVGTGSLSIEGNGTFGGKVSIGTDITPTEDNDLATKKYVDDNSTIKAIDCTRAEYDAMEYHDPDTYYNIIDEDNGLATHEADGLMSKEDKIKLDGMSGGDNTINGIPVDLTGIYNTQVIGYDETQGKLVPMTSVARTETVLPNTEIPVSWEWDLVNIPNWMGVSETSINKPSITNTSTASATKEDIIFSIKSTKSYLISEYTSAVFKLSIAYIKLNTSTFELSKDADFNTIDASFSVSFNINITANVSNLTGKYYWRYNFSGQSLGTTYSPGSMYLTFEKLNFSQGGTT